MQWRGIVMERKITHQIIWKINHQIILKKLTYIQNVECLQPNYLNIMYLLALNIVGTFAGIATLSFLAVAIYVVLERRNLSKVKEKYFQQHGGWILLENIKSNQGFGFTIFTKQQVEEATNNFDSANIVGHGGHGTVYKGTLRDETVAI